MVRASSKQTKQTTPAAVVQVISTPSVETKKSKKSKAEKSEASAAVVAAPVVETPSSTTEQPSSEQCQLSGKMVDFSAKLQQLLSKKIIDTKNILLSRERHRNKLNLCLLELEKILEKKQSKEIELAAEDLRMATRHLGAIIGKVDVEEILGSIFKDFCIGK